jgi:hypothetical protein
MSHDGSAPQKNLPVKKKNRKKEKITGEKEISGEKEKKPVEKKTR